MHFCPQLEGEKGYESSGEDKCEDEKVVCGDAVVNNGIVDGSELWLAGKPSHSVDFMRYGEYRCAYDDAYEGAGYQVAYKVYAEV